MTLSRVENRGTLTGRLQRTSGGGGGVTDYGDLTGKPKINNVTVNGDKNGHDYNLANLSDIPVVPPSPPSYAMNSHDDDYTTVDLEWIKSNDEEKQWKVYSSAFTPPTASSDGKKGLVPKALAGEEDKILSASGWITNKDNKDYSLLEQDTGLKWINGKNIYQKTVQLNPATSDGATYTSIDIAADDIIDFKVILKSNSNLWFSSPYPRASNSFFTYALEYNNNQWRFGLYKQITTQLSGYITIYYTK